MNAEEALTIAASLVGQSKYDIATKLIDAYYAGIEHAFKTAFIATKPVAKAAKRKGAKL